MINANRQVIIDRTAVLRLPAIYQFPEGAEQSGFAAYGPRIEHIWRQVFGLRQKGFEPWFDLAPPLSSGEK
jgi:hypothetical protein